MLGEVYWNYKKVDRAKSESFLHGRNFKEKGRNFQSDLKGKVFFLYREVGNWNSLKLISNHIRYIWIGTQIRKARKDTDLMRANGIGVDVQQRRTNMVGGRACFWAI